jgi:hypothetical protein
MKKLKSVAFAVALDQGRAYQFRYLIEETGWQNE